MKVKNANCFKYKQFLWFYPIQWLLTSSLIQTFPSIYGSESANKSRVDLWSINNKLDHNSSGNIENTRLSLTFLQEYDMEKFY